MPDSRPPIPTNQPQPDLTGRQLEDYRILRRIGQGGMAVVYLAEQASLKRQVAFKVLRVPLADDAHYVRRFHHEAQAAAKLVHANIVQTHEVGCIEGVHFIAQEYVAGQNLRQLLKRQGALQAPKAAQVISQVASALQTAAAQGVVHRDIKPENTLITPRGEVKVTDFGLARVVIEGQHVELTQVGMTMGTPLYMSPEQIEGTSIDPRSDIYSLGVMSYHMLAGRPPFEGESPLAIAVQHLREMPKRLEQVRDDLPEPLCRIIHKMMAKKPAERYDSPAAILSDLRELKFDGLDENWSETWSQLIPGETTLNGFEATQRLELVMQNQTMVVRRFRRRTSFFLSLIVGALLIGSAIALLFQPAPLFPDELANITDVVHKNTPREQLYYALEENTPRHYHAVAKYFPPTEAALNQYYGNLAQRYLAEYYRENGKLEEALTQYKALEDLGDASAEFTVVGLFGQARVLQLQDKSLAARSKLSKAHKVWQEIPQLQRPALLQSLDPELRQTFLEQLEIPDTEARDDPRSDIYSLVRYLAEYYRDNGKLEEALTQYKALEDLGDASAEFTVIGLFGQARVLQLQDKSLAARSKLSQAHQVWQEIPELQRPAVLQSLDPELRQTFLEQLEIPDTEARDTKNRD